MSTHLDRTRDNVLKLKYVNLLRVILASVGAWPGDELGQKLHWFSKCYRAYLPFQCLAIWIGELHYMINNDLDFMVLGDTVLTSLLTDLLLVRQIMPLLKGYREVTRDFFMDFHLIHFKHRGIHFEKVNEIVHRVCMYFTFYMVAMSFFGSILFNVCPIYVNYKTGAFAEERKGNITFYSAVSISYPFFSPLEIRKSITAFNFYCCIVCGISVCLIDLLLMLIAFHIIGHIVVLRRNLESITGPENSSAGVFNAEENRKLGLILKDCVDHHRVIVRFAYKMSDFFGFMLAVNYTFQLVGCCILLLESTQGNMSALIRFGPLTLIIFGQLIQISVIFEVVSTVSEKLPDILYSIPWECLDIRNQRSVCILLHRLQRPINVTAMGMTTVGVTTMAGILKTTFSYFAFLKSLNE